MSSLIHPLQAILIAPEHAMRVAVLNGTKKISIRQGHRDYRKGVVMLCCEKVPWCVAADITYVRHTIVSQVTEEEYAADGFTSREDMLGRMRRFYPDLTSDSPVTVVCWDNVRGYFADKADEYERDPETTYETIDCS